MKKRNLAWKFPISFLHQASRQAALAALLVGAIACGDATAPGAQGEPSADLAGGEQDGSPNVPVADSKFDGPLSDTPAASCSDPVAFAPSGAPSQWKHTSTRLLVVTQGAANHRGQDVVVTEGTLPVLIGKFAYGVFDKDLKEEEVEIHLQKDPPCGPWTLIGTALTSTENQYGSTYGIDDDGGRVFFEVPPEHQLPTGRYPIVMLVKGDHSLARLNLFVVKPQTSAVVFDIDGTLTTDDKEFMTQVFDQMLTKQYVPKMYPDAPAVAQAWADKGYQLVYLTGRPDFLHGISRQWLKDQGFPPGALHLTDTNLQVLPTNVDQYKADFLKRMTGEAKLDLVAAYGNATTDITAYEQAGVSKARTYIIGANAGAEGTVALKDYTSHLPVAQSMPAAPVPAPTSILGW